MMNGKYRIPSQRNICELTAKDDLIERKIKSSFLILILFGILHKEHDDLESCSLFYYLYLTFCDL